MSIRTTNLIFVLIAGRPFMMSKYLQSSQPDNWLKYGSLDIWDDEAAVGVFINVLLEL